MANSQFDGQMMNAVTIEHFGGPEVLTPAVIPIPPVGKGEVLVKVAYAGVGVWDGAMRAGLMETQAPAGATLPRVLGADGSGTVVDVGEGVTGFAEGDPVYAYAFFNPKGGTYAEYVVVPADQVALLPEGIPLDQGGALAVTGLTALRGVDDTLGLKAGDKVIIFGASGGVGLPAVQLAKAMGVRVLATVGSADGAEAADEAGADVVVNTRTGDLAGAIQSFAPEGVAGVLALVAGEGLDIAVAAVRDGGTVAYPFGVQPEPKGSARVTAKGYMGAPGREALDRLNALIASSSFFVHLSDQFDLSAASEAHQTLAAHHVGRIVLKVD